MADIKGTVESGFEGVRDALAANLDSGADVGASVAVLVDGRSVVDHLGRPHRRGPHATVGDRHHHQRLVDDQDHGGVVRTDARRSW